MHSLYVQPSVAGPPLTQSLRPNWIFLLEVKRPAVLDIERLGKALMLLRTTICYVSIISRKRTRLWLVWKYRPLHHHSWQKAILVCFCLPYKNTNNFYHRISHVHHHHQRRLQRRCGLIICEAFRPPPSTRPAHCASSLLCLVPGATCVLLTLYVC